MELSDLIRDERNLAVNVGDEILNVTYRPSGFTAAAEEKYLDAIERRRVNMAFVEALCEILTSWDLVQDGEPVSITLESLKMLPAKLLSDIFMAIVEDNRLGGKETRKNSGDGLRRAAK